MGWAGKEKKRIKDASKVLAEATERMELFTEIRKATVRRLLGRKIRVHFGKSSSFEVPVRPPSGDIFESAGIWMYESVFGNRGLHLEIISIVSTKM